jgi:predicted nuclease of predicted toxin-antitoxin system
LAEADDRAVWGYAGEHGFILVSQDADFAERATLLGPPPKVVWLRAGNQPTAAIERLLRSHAGAFTAFVEDRNAACLELY